MSFGGLIHWSFFINAPPTFPPQFQSLPSTPRKEGSEKKGLLGFWAPWGVRKGTETKAITGCDRDWQSRSLKQNGKGGKERGRMEKGEVLEAISPINPCVRRGWSRVSNIRKCRSWRREVVFDPQGGVGQGRRAPSLCVEWDPPTTLGAATAQTVDTFITGGNV